jgi:hypothetical protein
VGKTHWLPRPLNENCQRTACGIDVYEHPLVVWRTAQNEVDCRRCLTTNVPEDDDDD